jgi:hypothetical protein
MLFEFPLRGIDNAPSLIDGNGSDTGGASIDSEYNSHSERLRSR